MRLISAINLLLIFWAVTLFAQEAETDQSGFARGVYGVNLNYLLNNSAIGQEIKLRYDRETAKLSKFEQEISSELQAEEERLTELRPSMEVEEFVPLAEAFDANSTYQRDRINKLSQEIEYRFGIYQQRLYNELVKLSQNALELSQANIILDFGSNRSSVIAIRQENDLTPLLLSVVNENYTEDKARLDDIIFADVEPFQLEENETGALNGTLETPADPVLESDVKLENGSE